MNHLKPFVLRFTLSYLLIQASTGLLAIALDAMFGIDIPSTAITVTALGLTVALISHQFIKKHSRIFNQQERFHMAWTSVLASWLVSLILIIILIAGFTVYNDLTVSSLLRELPNDKLFFIIMSIALVFTTLLMWGLLYWMYGYIPKQLLKSSSKSTNS